MDDDIYIIFECDGLIQAISFEDMRELPHGYIWAEEFQPYESCHEIMDMFSMVPDRFFEEGRNE